MQNNFALEQRIERFARCGQFLLSCACEPSVPLLGRCASDWQQLLAKVCARHPFFTPDQVSHATRTWAHLLTEDALWNWCKQEEVVDCSFSEASVALIMAGNLPWVGFHDFLALSLLGFRVQGKTSSKDPYLWSFLLKNMPELEQNVQMCKEVHPPFDAIIATGGNNTFRYFDAYFGKYPHVLRKHRSSCAVLDGKETEADLSALWQDIGLYYGLGCRNVSKIYIPTSWDWARFLEIGNKEGWGKLMLCGAYADNYSYLKAVYEMDRTPFKDNGFMLFRETDSILPSVGELLYETYAEGTQGIDMLKKTSLDAWQCIVGSEQQQEALSIFGWQRTQMGQTQYPQLEDYADGISIPAFLKKNFAL